MNDSFLKKAAIIVVAAALVGGLGQGLLLWRWQAQASFQIDTLTSDVGEIKTILQNLYTLGR